MHFYCPITTAS